MPTLNVILTDELDRFVLEEVGSGRYESANDVVRAALCTLRQAEHQYEAKLSALQASIDKGDRSGVAEGNPFARVRKSLEISKKRC